MIKFSERKHIEVYYTATCHDCRIEDTKKFVNPTQQGKDVLQKIAHDILQARGWRINGDKQYCKKCIYKNRKGMKRELQNTMSISCNCDSCNKERKIDFVNSSFSNKKLIEIFNDDARVDGWFIDEKKEVNYCPKCAKAKR